MGREEAQRKGLPKERGMTTILKFNDIRKSFGELDVLKGIGLEVNKGDVVAILGPSGSCL